MKQMINISLLAIALCVTASAQAASPRSLAKKVEAAYLNGLAVLDGKRLINGRLKVVVEDSLSEDTETHYFRSFRDFERWLKKNEREDQTPFRATGDMSSCSRVRCIVEYRSGILHNHLYLKRIGFGYRNGRRYIKEVRLLDGA